ncbi:MAG TPA: preprotein translocase subunit SecG, partial [Planctomycetaceae bacterium]|nr:preprotein translocase subunit SecG [Planctomycetaceae bacterium]
MNALLIAALLPLSVFMILLVLIQRGKGGGLAGAFGG